MALSVTTFHWENFGDGIESMWNPYIVPGASAALPGNGSDREITHLPHWKGDVWASRTTFAEANEQLQTSAKNNYILLHG